MGSSFSLNQDIAVDSDDERFFREEKEVEHPKYLVRAIDAVGIRCRPPRVLWYYGRFGFPILRDVDTILYQTPFVYNDLTGVAMGITQLDTIIKIQEVT